MAKSRYFAVAGEQWQQLQDALRSARPYVETCTELDGKDEASAALLKVDDALLLRPIYEL